MEPLLVGAVLGAVTPDDLRKEANAAEFLARIVSYGKDRERLMARAAELRQQAISLERKAAPASGAKLGPCNQRPTGSLRRRSV